MPGIASSSILRIVKRSMIIYAGYFPMGLSVERIMSDMQQVPFKDEVWPKFLRDNARKILKLDNWKTHTGVSR